MKKRVFCMVLCLCLLCSMLAAPAMASHTCTDADADGWCDDCYELMPHFCRTCDSDAYCDICYEVMKHSCMYVDDYVICGKCFETADHSCVDSDEDYWCDRCFTWIEHTCKDADRDYWCDLCNWVMDHTCRDADEDYWCDICDEWQEHECIDADGDYYCELCFGLQYHECEDTDGDSYCDICFDYLISEGMFPTVSGTVKSGIDALEPVYVDIYDPEGTYINFGILTGETPAYQLLVFADETYSILVSKANHVTRTYTLNVADEPVSLDLTVCPIGDVSGDCKLNVGDTAKIYSHVRGTAELTDEYALDCADVSGDGEITVGDVAKLYAHIRGMKTLW